MNEQINIVTFFDRLYSLSDKWNKLSKLKDQLADESTVKLECKKELESESRMLYNCARELNSLVKIFETLKS